jgi:tRNA(fMet)-specific endonuclease VapC
MFLLDTDTIIYSLKGDAIVTENFRIHAKNPKAISVISYGELVYGAEKSKKVSHNLAKVHRLRELFPIIEITCAIMDTYGAIKSQMTRNGSVIDEFDLLIGATAIVMGYAVVTNNQKHFSKIPDLKVVNWATPS